MSTTTASDTFDRMTRDERWEGYGYLGERARFRNGHLDGEQPTWLSGERRAQIVADTDRRAMDEALARGWTGSKVFEWANSRAGRHFADLAFTHPDRIDEAVESYFELP